MKQNNFSEEKQKMTEVGKRVKIKVIFLFIPELKS